MNERRTALISALRSAGCSDPASWADSELREDIPQFARFLVLRDVHRLADDVDSALAETLFDRDDLAATLQALRSAVPAAALEALLRAYGQALGNSFVMAVDEGPSMREDGMPGWVLMETDADDTPSGRLIQGLHEDYLDFATSVAP
ncbi:hypothetical protein [Stenotrophomonas sp.]|uniref:hypothetical protein n=1 Tax=Stenotrophomonas sp. TaxID=69392 RepID=UPI0028AF735E|nr:hypothetical protein [Stenotrophomonas sp.]